MLLLKGLYSFLCSYLFFCFDFLHLLKFWTVYKFVKNRFEFYYKDSYIQADGNVSDEDGTEEGLLRFILKDIQVLDWTKMSSINQLTLSTYLNESWVIRNFQRMTNDVSYTDALMIVDLTETFGSGNEPSIEWCDENIEYFEGTSVIYK